MPKPVTNVQTTLQKSKTTTAYVTAIPAN